MPWIHEVSQELIIMEAVMRDKGVLKLVHPGRYVEIHKEPITAAEVMKRNPRHSITRPDFFKFPSVVVDSESILLPGKVFFIVPNRIVYRLLKAHHQENHRNQQHNKIQKPRKTRNASVSDTDDDDQLPKKSSPSKSWAGVTPRHLLSNNTCLFPWKESNPRKHSQVKSWPPDAIHVKKIKPQPQPSQEKKQQLLVDSKKKEKYQSTSSNEIKEILHQDHQPEAKRCNKQVTILKSCLRKPGDSSTHRKKVTFLLSKEHHEKPARRIRESQEWPDRYLLNL